MSKRRKGQLIKVIVTVGDFICINMVYILACLLLPHDLIDSFNRKIVWFVLNIAYIPVNIMFRDVHNNRVTYIDELLLTTTKSVLLYFLIFLSLSMFLQFEIKAKTLAIFFVGLYATLNLWWIIVNRLLKFYRRKGYNFRRVVIVGAGKTGIMPLWQSARKTCGRCGRNSPRPKNRSHRRSPRPFCWCLQAGRRRVSTDIE